MRGGQKNNKKNGKKKSNYELGITNSFMFRQNIAFSVIVCYNKVNSEVQSGGLGDDAE